MKTVVIVSEENVEALSVDVEVFERSGYSPITFVEFSGMLASFGSYLRSMLVDACGIARVFSLVSTGRPFLVETVCGEFWVAKEV